jgi:hypothetical protein
MLSLGAPSSSPLFHGGKCVAERSPHIKMSSPSRDRECIGSELELLAEAVNWRTCWQRQAVPFLGRRVLEVGAGFGTVTGDLAARGSSTGWRSNRIEPRPPIWRRIGRRPPAGDVRAALRQHRDAWT